MNLDIDLRWNERDMMKWHSYEMRYYYIIFTYVWVLKGFYDKIYTLFLTMFLRCNIIGQIDGFK